MKIEKFDRQTCRLVSLKVAEALQPLAKELGVRIVTKGGSFIGGSFTVKVEVATVGEGGLVQSKEAEEFKILAAAYGLKAEDLGSTFYSCGHPYTIVGIRPRAIRTPIIVSAKDGKMYRFGATLVANALNSYSKGALS